MKKTSSMLQSEIDALKEKKRIITARADDDGRSLTSSEDELLHDIDNHCRELQSQINQMPANRPLTMQGPGRSNRTPGKIFNSFGEQLIAIRDAGIPSGRIDNRLHEVRNAFGLNETTPSEGGFLVEPQFSAELLREVYEVGQISKLCRRIQIGNNSNAVKIPGLDETSRATGSRWGGVRSYWVSEAGEKTASAPKFRQIELILKKCAVLVYATDELLSDSSVLADVISRTARDELAFVLDDTIIRGTGAGQCLGVLNAGCLVTQAQEVGQDAGTLLAENIVKMWSRLLPASQRSAVWLLNSELLPSLYLLGLQVGLGGAPLYQPPGGLSQAPYGTIFGRPLMVIEQASAVGTTGDIILADFTNGYLLAEKGGVEAAMSIHVRFIFDESVFRFVLRIDGQPILSSSIAPYQGTLNQSHFVALDRA